MYLLMSAFHSGPWLKRIGTLTLRDASPPGSQAAS